MKSTKFYFAILRTLVVLSLSTQFANAQIPALAADINVGSGSSDLMGSLFGYSILFNGNLYFSADNGSTGQELFSFDGTTATLIADINQGSSGSNPMGFKILGSNLYFAANDGVHGMELWTFDGEDVSLAVDFMPGAGSGIPVPYALSRGLLWDVYNGKIYLGADDGSGAVLWSYDGVSASIESSAVSNPFDFITYDGMLVFSSFSNLNEYTYDGSNVTQITGGVGLMNAAYPVIYNDKLYFRGTTGAGGSNFQLMCYDGNIVTQVSDLNNGTVPYGFDPGPGLILEGRLYMSGHDDTTVGSELYSYDGVELLVAADISPGTENSSPSIVQGTNFDGRMYFTATTEASGYELWSFNGTTATLEAEIEPGSAGSIPTPIMILNNALYFAATSSETGRELWEFAPIIYNINTPGYKENPITIYPNPVRSSAILQFETTEKDLEVVIYDQPGNIILSKRLVGNQMVLESGSLKSGIYFVKVSNLEHQFIQKLVIE